MFSPLAILHGTMAPNSGMGIYYWMFIVLTPCINFVVFPAVQTLTSDELREHVFGCFFTRKSTCREGGGEDENNPAAGEIELGVLPNGIGALPNGIAVIPVANL